MLATSDRLTVTFSQAAATDAVMAMVAGALVELAGEATSHVDTPRALRTCKTIRTRTNRSIPARTSQRRNVGQVTAWPPRTGTSARTPRPAAGGSRP